MRKSMFMENTDVETSRTIGEIQKLLSFYGATAIETRYQKGEIVGLSFTIMVKTQEVPFVLPCRWKPIFTRLQGKRRRERDRIKADSRDQAQAKKIAWRQTLRWVEAQMAFVENEQAQVQEVFLPFMLAKDGKTLYSYIEEKQFLLEYKEN